MLERLDVAARYMMGARYCGFCGWLRSRHHLEHRIIEDIWHEESLLRTLDINSAEVSFKELQQAIVAYPDRIDHMHHRRFEQLIADVFRNNGYSVELTRSTRDGGRDLIVLRKDSNEEAIVEVKRHRRRVGVELVRQLRGVQLRDGVPHAALVAARGFTSDAHVEASSPRPAALGFNLSLLDALDLLRSLDLLREPAQSISALNRHREAYRAWIVGQQSEMAVRRDQGSWREYLPD